jgi:indole-3-glycerol phosphate synthase
MKFLDEMAAVSRDRVRSAQAKTPITELRRRCADAVPAPPLKLAGGFDLIAEIKFRSPAVGQLVNAGVLVADRARAYAGGGAAAVSVLTEPTRFGGSLDHLAEAAAALAPLGVPAMRKDFLIDPYQLYEGRAAGAGGALLIVRLLSRNALIEMLDCAGELGLFTLVEMFDEEDVAKAKSALWAAKFSAGLPPTLIGANCRDLETLAFDQRRLIEIAPILPRNLPHVAESGIETEADVERIAEAGYEAALVGSALMGAADAGDLVRRLIAAGRRAT